jgi:hypothetical protein
MIHVTYNPFFTMINFLNYFKMPCFGMNSVVIKQNPSLRVLPTLSKSQF